ncbi:MAG: RluA family pseudouridine synthase [Acidobacteriota bacterium]
MLEISVPEACAGWRLDRFLAEQIPEATRAAVQRWIAAGRVWVDGRTRKPSYRLRPGEKVTADPPPAEPLELVPDAISLRVLYEDEDVLVVDKPAGLVVHPGAGVRRGTLANALVHRYRDLPQAETLRPGIVHRLDKGTSGLLVVALNEVAHHRLVRQFQRREVDKRYVALLYGHLQPAEGGIDLPLGRDRRQRTRISGNTDRPRPALTLYRVLRYYPAGFTLVEARPVTGRTHQIRVHFWSRGHPVVGDETYQRRDKTRALPGGGHLGRLFLHAAELEFTHPRTGERLRFAAPLPPELAALLDRLEQ